MEKINYDYRLHGRPEYKVAVVHGGPGAAGEMAPVARRLADHFGVIEPFQTAGTLESQIEELAFIIKDYCSIPVILIGFSWGAWLVALTASRYPHLTKKLVLIGSGPFEERDAHKVMQNRLEKLNESERKALKTNIEKLQSSEIKEKSIYLEKVGALCEKTDSYDPVASTEASQDNGMLSGDIFQNVWKQAAELRRSGGLLQVVRKIKCPVTAIHGAYDPHPPEGVEKPLSRALKRFRFILLDRCGHKPWIEKHARQDFYRVLIDETLSC